MVQIISQHGYWPDFGLPVRCGAFQNSFTAGFGTEADLRDGGGALLVASGCEGDRELRLPDLLDIMDGLDLPLGLHVQSAGLGAALGIEMQRHAPRQWFAFDMPPCDMADYLSLGLPAYARVGAVNDNVPFYDQAAGVWVDTGAGSWIEPRHLNAFLSDGKKLCMVEADGSSAACSRIWNLLRDKSIRDHPALMLCTKRPTEAAAFFAPTST